MLLQQAHPHLSFLFCSGVLINLISPALNNLYIVENKLLEFGMEAPTLTGLARTKSDQLLELMRLKSPSRSAAIDAAAAAATATSNGGTSGLLRKPSRGKLVGGTSPGRGPNHIRKSRSDEVTSGAALSRASSASLGFSFSLAGFTTPPQEIPHAHTFSDEENVEEVDAGARRKIVTDPTLPIFLKFTDVKYKVIVKSLRTSTEKDILNGITGSATPGEVLALMGPSGCGKTTLLNLLSGRLPSFATLAGTITYNDQPYSKALKRRIGYVTQDDVLFPHLTVKETLTYAALLRLPNTMTKQQKEERATNVICELGLERCQDTMIGGSFVRGVSGGERKRVCIGNEIIINPSLLFLDEPTSGLDSTTALRIVQMLHDIAEAGKTVVTTIHQPSSRLFHKFDKLILLGKGSLLFYGKASEAMLYFSSIGCSPLIAMNPAEFLIDLSNGNLNDVSIPSELEDRVQTENTKSEPRNKKPSPVDVQEYLAEAYETKVADKEKKKLEVPSPVDEATKLQVSSPKREWGAGWIEQYCILFKRGIKERKHEYLSWMRITQVLATAIILGLLWWHSDSSTYRGLQDQTGLLFFISVFWGFFPVFTAIFTFPQERAMLNKEKAADMYRLSAYFMARTTSDLPLDLILPVIFLVVVYFMANLNRGVAPFVLTILIVFLSIVAAQGLGLAIGASLVDVKKATTLASVTVMTFMLAGGFFVKRVPVFISWIRYVSFNYHTYRLLLKVQYRKVPSNIIHRIHLDNGVVEIGALVGMVVAYRLLAYIQLRRMKIQ